MVMINQSNVLMQKVVVLAITIIFSFISIFMGLNGYDKLCFLFSIIGYLFMTFGIIINLKNFTNISMVFIIFMFLYTYSGVFSAIWGEGLHPIFSSNYNTSAFLILSNIAYSSLLAGLTFFYKNSKDVQESIELVATASKNANFFLRKATFLAWVAFVFEFINFIRIGGFNAIALGKAYYGSMLSELTMTLPSEILTVISVIYFSLYIGNKTLVKGKRNYLFPPFFILPISGNLTLYILLGQRGILLTIALILIVGATYFRPIKKISLKIILSILILYFLMSVLYSARAYIGYYLFDQKDIQGLLNIIFNKERLIEALIPSQNEFGVAFGNFNEYIISDKQDLKLGITYLKGLLIPIPSWFYPGEKPLQILYEFRNIYFPSEMERGSIASTGFSFLLEAYMNFGLFGVVGVYFLLGVTLAKLEVIRSRKASISLFPSIYLACFAVVGSFQRNAFGDVYSTLVMYFIIILIFSIEVKYRKRENTML